MSCRSDNDRQKGTQVDTLTSERLASVTHNLMTNRRTTDSAIAGVKLL